jgi:hypothetical protein
MIYTKELLQIKAPAIFAESPSTRVSDKYTFVPTYKIIQLLEENGYYVTEAEQGKLKGSRGQKGLFNKHVVRLRHKDYIDFKGNDIPEFIIINSHNGLSALSFYFGIFRFICENGLVISSLNLMSFKSKHIHFEYEVFEGIVNDYASKVDDVMEIINKYSNIMLTEKQKNEFAKKAKDIIWPSGSFVPEEMLIKPRREEDNKDDLYTIFNVVQENAMKGSIEYYSKSRRVRTKKIEAVDRKLKVNLGLWQLAEQFS